MTRVSKHGYCEKESRWLCRQGSPITRTGADARAHRRPTKQRGQGTPNLRPDVEHLTWLVEHEQMNSHPSCCLLRISMGLCGVSSRISGLQTTVPRLYRKGGLPGDIPSAATPKNNRGRGQVSTFSRGRVFFDSGGVEVMVPTMLQRGFGDPGEEPPPYFFNPFLMGFRVGGGSLLGTRSLNKNRMKKNSQNVLCHCDNCDNFGVVA